MCMCESEYVRDMHPSEFQIFVKDKHYISSVTAIFIIGQYYVFQNFGTIFMRKINIKTLKQAQ